MISVKRKINHVIITISVLIMIPRHCHCDLTETLRSVTFLSVNAAELKLSVQYNSVYHSPVVLKSQGLVRGSTLDPTGV